MEKELKTVVPDGYEIDKEKSSLERIVFKKKEPKLPESWEEFCDMTRRAGYYLDIDGNIVQNGRNMDTMLYYSDRMLQSSKEDCEAHRALMQLHRLRDCYRQGWIPRDGAAGHTIYVGDKGDIHVAWIRGFLSFQRREIASKFAVHFRELILTAKELLR